MTIADRASTGTAKETLVLIGSRPRQKSELLGRFDTLSDHLQADCAFDHPPAL
jgi:hypothetical protein